MSHIGKSLPMIYIQALRSLSFLRSDMKRREFIGVLAGMATAWPVAARAQKSTARIALLGSGSAGSSGVFVDAFKEGLREHGLIEGQHYVLDARWAEGAYARFPQLAEELAAQRPRVIMVTTNRRRAGCAT
jgi:putative tryptophan/tyrosine transport system substrate-binding protein